MGDGARNRECSLRGRLPRIRLMWFGRWVPMAGNTLSTRAERARPRSLVLLKTRGERDRSGTTADVNTQGFALSFFHQLEIDFLALFFFHQPATTENRLTGQGGQLTSLAKVEKGDVTCRDGQ